MIDSITIENSAALTAGSTVTIATLTGEGTIESIWLALKGATVKRDARLQVLVDGEANPSVDVDLGGLGFHFSGGVNNHSLKHVAVHENPGSLESSVLFKFAIPFSEGAIVKVYNPTTHDATQLFSQVVRSDAVASRRLKSVCVPYANAVTVAAGDNYQFADIAAAGSVVFFGLTCNGISNNSFHERNIRLTADGSHVLDSTGTEDWFTSAWGTAYGPFDNPWGFTAVVDSSRHEVRALDLDEWLGGVPFTESFLLEWLSEAAVATDVQIGFVLLYYED